MIMQVELRILAKRITLRPLIKTNMIWNKRTVFRERLVYEYLFKAYMSSSSPIINKVTNKYHK